MSAETKLTVAKGVFVLSENPPTLSVIDEATNEFKVSVKLEDSPLSIGIHRDRRKAYIGLFNRGIVVYSLNDGSIQTTVKTKQGFGACPDTLALSPSGRHLLVMDTQPVDLCWATCTVICTNDATIKATSHTELYRMSEEGIDPGSPGFPSLAFSATGEKLFVAVPSMSRVSVIDAVALAAVGTIPIGDRMGPLASTPDGEKLCISNFGKDGPRLSVLDAEADGVTRTVALPGSPGSMVFNPDGAFVYVATDPPEAKLIVLDLDEGEPVATIPLEHACSALVMAPDGERIFASHPHEKRVSIISTHDCCVSENIELREPASHLHLSSDGSKLYAAHGSQALVTVIGVDEQPTELASVEVGERPSFVDAFSTNGTRTER